MPPKRQGPLQTVQRETDDIKRQVDSLIKDARLSGGSGRTEAYQSRCIHLQNLVEETTRKLKKLTKADEPAPVGNYDQRKMEEECRLRGIEEKLLVLVQELSPPQKREGGPHRSSQAQEDEEEEDSSEEDSEEEESVEDEEEVDEEDVVTKTMEQIPESGTATYMVISAFKGEQEGDLTIQMGEVLTILSKNEDGWWLAQDSKGSKGLVPKTYLKRYSDQDEDDDEEASEDEELESKRKQSSNWDSVRRAITEIDATDVLSAMGAIPAGFRSSTLSKLLNEGITYRASHYIQPELSQSKLSFKDLFRDPDTGKVRQRTARTSLTLTLWSCKSIPTPGVGVQVLSRHIRLCAFDGTQVLSNIHTIRATCQANNVKTWSFSPRMTGNLPSLLDGDCFLRCNSDAPELGILFELGVTYIRNSTGERGDLSCGWAFLKLFDTNGAPVPHRTYELLVHGGTPYEKDIEVDPSLTRGATGTGMFQQMMLSRKLPKLFLKLKSPNVRTRSQLSALPDTLVGSLSSIHLLVLHRQLLADILLMDRATMQNADLICSPLLATFPEIMDQSDLLDALRKSWLEAESNMKRSEKRDLPLLKRKFVRVYMDNMYPLLYSADLPPPRWADEMVENQRARVIFNSSLEPFHTHTPDSPPRHQAFDISQLTYDLLCMAQ
ncbi:nephrocystin-1 [Salvelinus namaycush]|uniref:Nephrocystin-1 n=1 Tax=Salvelinus namaycush TaxID=8040 RepID=A0A8U0P2F5_SALNM|nr:nephrocystin-1 [Salvelinus namaycush]